MRAIVQDSYGPAEQWRLAEIAEPEIADSEVLVNVHNAGLDRGTWHAMTGLPYLGRLYFGLRKPKRSVPGLDVAGTVAAIGVALTGLRRRPVGNALIIAGVAVAAAGSAIAGLGEGGGALFAAAAAALLYGGFVSPR